VLIANDIKKTYIIKERKSLWSRHIKHIEAVKGINIKVEKGKIIGIIGLNGAGKTTTIKMLSSLLTPTAGEILIDGIDVVTNYMIAKKHINLISGSERGLYWRLTARENLKYFGSLYHIPANELDNRIDKILDIVDMKEFADIAIEKYSKGMKQRIQIARGLINNPDYVFLDEPTLGLDIVRASEMRKYIKKISVVENKGIVLTTHYIHEIEELCDYIYLIDKGTVVLEGSIDEIKKYYDKTFSYELQLTSEKQLEKRTIHKIEVLKVKVDYDSKNMLLKITSNENRLSEVLAILLSDEIGIDDIKSLKMNLEDILLRIYCKDLG